MLFGGGWQEFLVGLLIFFFGLALGVGRGGVYTPVSPSSEKAPYGLSLLLRSLDFRSSLPFPLSHPAHPSGLRGGVPLPRALCSMTHGSCCPCTCMSSCLMISCISSAPSWFTQHDQSSPRPCGCVSVKFIPQLAALYCKAGSV